MATNTGKGSRKGAVKGRTQVLNTKTGTYVKRDTATGQFIGGKADGKPFKGVTKEKVTIKDNPNVSKAIAKQAEFAVLNLKKQQNGKSK